jgi:hypothetical protein
MSEGESRLVSLGVSLDISGHYGLPLSVALLLGASKWIPERGNKKKAGEKWWGESPPLTNAALSLSVSVKSLLC